MKYAFIKEWSPWNKKISKDVHAYFAFVGIGSPQWTIYTKTI